MQTAITQQLILRQPALKATENLLRITIIMITNLTVTAIGVQDTAQLYRAKMCKDMSIHTL